VKTQTLSTVCTTATTDHCAFAVQGITNLGGSRLAGFGGTWPWYELLMRPHSMHPNGSDSSLESFIDRLYEKRAPHLSDGEVVDRALHWLMRRETPTRISINTHPLSLSTSPFRDLAIRAQRLVATRGHSICIELIEFGEYKDRNALITNARMLRDHGVLIALDDFGSRVNVFDLCAAGIIDVLKIDMAIVRQLDRDSYQRAIVDSIVRLGFGIGAQVVAEGVETRAELASLESLGVDFAQGYYFHRPELSEI